VTATRARPTATRCHVCGGRVGEHSLREDTAAGQAWLCAGCLLVRRRLQLRDQLAALTAMIDAEMCRAEDATLAPGEREEARNLARGLATALSVIVGG
jgi:hypothetical protein